MKFYIQIEVEDTIEDADVKATDLIADRILKVLDAVAEVSQEILDITEVELPSGAVVKELR